MPCADPASKCRSAWVEHSDQKLLPVAVRRLWSCHWEQKKNRTHVPKFLLVAIMGPVNRYTKFCLLNWFQMWWSATRASLTYDFLCVRHGSITPALLNENKFGHGYLWAINWLPWLMPRCLLLCDCYMIIMTLSGSIRAQLMVCGYPHVSISSSSMLTAATGICQCLQIWIREFTILKQSLSQLSWQSFPFHIYGLWCLGKYER